MYLLMFLFVYFQIDTFNTLQLEGLSEFYLLNVLVKISITLFLKSSYNLKNIFQSFEIYF